MAKKSVRQPKATRVGEAKVAKNYRLEPNKIAAARAVLGTPTDTATIETALDMVIFRKELVEGTARMLGVELDAPFDS